MPKTLTFLHTSPVHIATFDRLLAEIDPGIPARHVVDESLLRDARAQGITAELERRVAQALKDAIADDTAVVVCTCSTIGGCAERADHGSDRPVVRVDRAMADRAVSTSTRIVVVATVASTLAPTRQLIQEVADQVGKAVTIVDVLCEEAWAIFERGDQSGYLASVAGCVRRVAPAGDVVVLAQASMAGATELCDDVRIPILSSPRLGLEAAVRAYRATT